MQNQIFVIILKAKNISWCKTALIQKQKKNAHFVICNSSELIFAQNYVFKTENKITKIFRLIVY